MKRFFFFLSLLISVSIGQVWGADPTISWAFKTLQTTSGTQDGITWETGKTGSATATACNSSNGLVLYGVSSGGGYFQTTSAISGTITNVNVVSAAKKNTPKYTVYCSADGSNWTEIASDQTAGTKDHAVTGSYTYVKLANTTAATAQLAVTSITVTYTPSGDTPTPTPTLSVAPTTIDFGTIEQNAVVENKTVEVTFADLSGSVTYSSLSSPFTASGTISATGDKITISANTATAGDYSQTLTVQSSADNKSAEVTVKMKVEEPFEGQKLTFDFVTHPEGWPTAKAAAAAGDYTYSLNSVDYTFTHSKTGDGIYMTGTSGTSGALLIVSGNTLGFPAISGYKLVKVDGTLNSAGTPSTGSSVSITDGSNIVSGGTAQTWDTKGGVKTYNLSGTAANTRYYLSVASKNLQMMTLVLYYVEAEAPAVETPTISGETPFFNTTDVTISIPEGATVYYTIDGSTPSDASTQYSAPFALNNSATVKAIAKIGSAYSSVVEKPFTKVTVMTVAEARAAIDAGGDLSNKYVAGTISQIDSYSSQYHSITYWISDDGTTTDQLEVYSGLAGVVKAQFASVKDLAVGDDVTVNGTLKKYNSTYEFDKNNTIVAYKPIARLSWSESSYEADLSGSNTFPTLTKPDGITVSYSSSDPSKAEINSSTGVITLKAVGSTTITATFAGNATYKANSASYTLNVANSVVRGTITYNVDGGSEVEALEDQTALPDPLPTTTKAGKNFGGWFTDSQKTIAAVAGAAIDGDITLYAKWLDPYTVAEAKTVIDGLNGGTKENQYVTGVISQVDSYNNSYHSITYWISADGTTDNQLEVYSGLIGNAATALDKEQFTDKTDLQLGDQVVVCGTLKKYNDVYEFDKNNTIYSFSRSEVAVSSVELQESTAEVEEGKTVTLHASVLPANASNKSITWIVQSGSDKASVADGVVTGIAEGTAVIRATSAADNTKYAECTVTVTAAAPLSPYAEVYTSNITLSTDGCTSASLAKVKLTSDGTDYDALKAGTSSVTGVLAVTVPAGATKLHFHAYGWKGESVILSITASNGVTVSPGAISLIANAGVTSNSPFTLAENSAPQTDAYFSVTLSGNSDGTLLLFTPTSGKRFVIFGVNQEGAAVPASITADPTALAFGSVDQGAEVEAKTINVTLTEVAAATVALSGEGASAFSIDKAALSESGTITVTPNTTTVGSYAATITISDNASEADPVEVAVSMTVTEPAQHDDVTGTWTLVTETSQIAVGKKVIIAQSVETDGAINTMASQSTNNRSVVASTVAGSTLTPTVGTAVMTLADAGEGKFYLTTSDGEYLYNASTSNKSYLKTKAESEDASWTIEVAEGVATITSVENKNRPIMRYNPNTSGSPLFNCYASGQNDIALYVQQQDDPEEPVYNFEDVRTGLEIGRHYTACLTKKIVAVRGATIWGLRYRNDAGTIAYLEEAQLPLAAGTPFIYQATDAIFEASYEGADAEQPIESGALRGTFDGLSSSELESLKESHTVYLMYNNSLRPLGTNNHLDAFRAYLLVDAMTVPSETPQDTPGRHVRSMSMQGNVATGIEDTESAAQAVKVMIDGQLFIQRGDKLYDVTGQMVK